MLLTEVIHNTGYSAPNRGNVYVTLVIVLLTEVMYTYSAPNEGNVYVTLHGYSAEVMYT